MIEYLDVYKTFDVPVLAGLSMTVARGETLAVVGPSGTGKSVLLKTTIGLIVPDAGDVRIEGQSMFDSDRATIERLRQKVGYVFQNAALFDSMNIHDNVAQGLRDSELRKLGKRELLRRVSESLDMVNLDPWTILSKLPSELSGGMRKRVGLARAIIGQPAIILYDEPVTGLDPVNTAAVDRLIEEVNERMGVTSIVVTHDIEGGLTVADRVALLDKGKLRFIGTPDDFRTSTDPLVRAFADRKAAAAMIDTE